MPNSSRRQAFFPAVTALGLCLCLFGQPSLAAPTEIGALKQAEEAITRAGSLLQEPYRRSDVMQAETALCHADTSLAVLLRGLPPKEAAASQGLDGFVLLNVFNRYNELAESAEGLHRLGDDRAWASDAASQAYVAHKQTLLRRARQVLPAALLSAFIELAGDRDGPETFNLPRTLTTGARYGYDIGRYRRCDTYTRRHDGQLQREVTLEPWPKER